jgi:polyferredoxin
MENEEQNHVAKAKLKHKVHAGGRISGLESQCVVCGMCVECVNNNNDSERY